MRKKNTTQKISLKTKVLIIIAVFFLTISVGYSYLKQSLDIIGKSTIVQQSTGDYEKGNSTYTWEIVNSWGQGGTTDKVYQVKLSIVNMDTDINSWVVGFDVPSSYDDASSNMWVASSRTYENGRLTLFAQDWNGFVAKGSTLELEIQLAFSQDEELYLNNLTLNGLLATNE